MWAAGGGLWSPRWSRLSLAAGCVTYRVSPPARGCRRTRPAGGEAVFPGVTDLFRLRCVGRDVGVDSLAAELVIDRRLVHGATP
jgi:hypothetical protein